MRFRGSARNSFGDVTDSAMRNAGYISPENSRVMYNLLALPTFRDAERNF
jgi:hypothetical protein